jgi:hypothetical protein
MTWVAKAQIPTLPMEFVDGKTLRDLLEAGPIPIKKSLQIVAQIGRPCISGLAWFDLQRGPPAFRGRQREPFSESWMR